MQLTPDELDSGQLGDEHLHDALAQLDVNGYVIFERVLPAEFLAELLAEFRREFEALVARTDPNRGTNRYQMHLPFRRPFIDRRVIAHPLALAVIDALLGSDCICHYFASDTACPGSEYQQVHADIHRLFPERRVAEPPYCLVVNLPLVDFREDNGPLEIFPGGTHHVGAHPDIARLAEPMHRQPCLMPAGSLLIRDARMWHRGTPNRSTEIRPNLALIYARGWFRTKYPPIEIPRLTYEQLGPREQELFRLEQIT